MSIEAMKQALEALEGIYIAPENLDYIADWWPACRDSIPALRQAIADEEKQEPVAWRTYTGRGYYVIDPTLEEAQKHWPDKTHQPLYTTPQPKQEQGEPVAKVCHDLDGHIGWNPNLTELPDEGVALYIAPQQRKPLTDEQLDDAIDAWFKPDADGNYPNWRERMRAAIESFNGIKE